MSTVLIVIIVLAAIALALILGVNLWGIRTQQRDRRHVFGRSRRRRRPT